MKDVNSLRIVYMGTPEFAVAPLAKLLNAGYNVVAVITAPDKPSGRGKKIHYSAVKQFVLDKNLDSEANPEANPETNPGQPLLLLQPENLKDPGFVNELSGLQPDLQVVVAFRMLPKVVWQIPRLGTCNLHASLLPQYRGAAPINHAIMNGESITGVTTFMIDEKIDTGNILLQKKTTIGETDTAGELHDRLMILGATLVLETVNRLVSGRLEALSQESFSTGEAELMHAPKINKDLRHISWDQPGTNVNNLIRGLSPSPAAFSFLNRSEAKKVLFKIFSSAFEVAAHTEPPGTIRSDGKNFLKVAVRDGYITLHSVQQEGKRRMDIGEFLAGFNLVSGPHWFS